MMQISDWVENVHRLLAPTAMKYIFLFILSLITESGLLFYCFLNTTSAK